MEPNNPDDAARLRFLKELFGWSPGDPVPDFSTDNDAADFWDKTDLTEVSGLRILSDGESRELLGSMKGLHFTPEVLERMARNGITISEVIEVIDGARKSIERD